ncbi:MAG: GntR family transcriptional regulator [Bacteroidaceae bacterium]|nr:GntR family transcriptional regulator [Bacteroidaceae bacterium]
MQIAERICDMILDERLREGERVPSVRETAAEMEVNINTVNRAYAVLQSQDIIDTQRGLGYFVNEGASTRIYDSRRNEFIERELPDFMERARKLGLAKADIVRAFEKEGWNEGEL